jgi:hypothetical protein
MLCPACNREIPDTAVACTYCGHRWATEELPIPPPPGPPQGMPAPPSQMPQTPPSQTPYPSYTPPAQTPYAPTGAPSPYYTPTPAYAPAARSAGATQATILLALVASGVVIGSAFMSWFSAMGMSGASGWDLFDTARQIGAPFNEWFYTTQGAWFFTGLFAVITGGLFVVQALIALVPPAGPRSPVAIVGLGIICFGGALINIISIFGNSLFAGVSPGVGLWVWAVAALAAPILLLASPGPRR